MSAGRRRFRPYDVGRTCHRCGGPLVPVRGQPEYARCRRCGRSEWRPDPFAELAAPAPGPNGLPDRDAATADTALEPGRRGRDRPPGRS